MWDNNMFNQVLCPHQLVLMKPSGAQYIVGTTQQGDQTHTRFRAVHLSSIIMSARLDYTREEIVYKQASERWSFSSTYPLEYESPVGPQCRSPSCL